MLKRGLKITGSRFFTKAKVGLITMRKQAPSHPDSRHSMIIKALAHK